MLLADVRRVLCVAAHPDDEVLGAGATMAALADRGCEVHALVLGEGVGARFPDNRRPDEEVARLSRQVTDAAAILGAIPHQLALPDNRFDSLDMIDVIHAVEEFKSEIQPDLVLTHHSGDMNIDHRVTCNAVLTAFRPVSGERRVTLLAFETLSSTEWNPPPNGMPFVPNWFEDASPGLERKVDAMAVYSEELRDWPHPRSLEGIRVSARRWGMTVGLEAAEPFMLLRYVGEDPPGSAPSSRTGIASLELRSAAPGDEELLLGWRNDPAVRRSAFHQEEVTPDTHRAWFEEKLASADATITIVEEAGEAVGQVRLDRTSADSAEIHIAIASGARGRGLGRRALRSALEAIPAHWPELRHVRALVKPDNEASLKAFAAAGFDETDRSDEAVELRYDL
jgi:LmbE family N-acetylglucosaminyl deacetylase/RimJ/RimL family protein N-acetyltransferase